MSEDVGGFGARNQRWAVLSAMTQEYWRYSDYENRKVSSVALVIIHEQCFSQNFVQPRLDTRIYITLSSPSGSEPSDRPSSLLDQLREVTFTRHHTF